MVELLGLVNYSMSSAATLSALELLGLVNYSMSSAATLSALELPGLVTDYVICSYIVSTGVTRPGHWLQVISSSTLSNRVTLQPQPSDQSLVIGIPAVICWPISFLVSVLFSLGIVGEFCWCIGLGVRLPHFQFTTSAKCMQLNGLIPRALSQPCSESNPISVIKIISPFPGGLSLVQH